MKSIFNEYKSGFYKGQKYFLELLQNGDHKMIHPLVSESEVEYYKSEDNIEMLGYIDGFNLTQEDCFFGKDIDDIQKSVKNDVLSNYQSRCLK